jgi:hypothetical protein
LVACKVITISQKAAMRFHNLALLRKVGIFSNYRILTPLFFSICRHFQLPVFDASKKGFGIQDSVVRILEKSRRQKPVVVLPSQRQEWRRRNPVVPLLRKAIPTCDDCRQQCILASDNERTILTLWPVPD